VLLWGRWKINARAPQWNWCHSWLNGPYDDQCLRSPSSFHGTVFTQSSPFLTGANSLQTNFLAWLTPVAIILIMVLGGMAMANRIYRPVNGRQAFFHR
jgi:hypothetical protein